MQWTSDWKGICFFSFAMVILLSSCVPHRELIILNEGEEVVEGLHPDSIAKVVQSQPLPPYRIRANDQLMIQVNAFEGSTDQFINEELNNNQNNNNFNFNPPAIYFNSYTVNDSGYIKLPMLEDVRVEGLTVFEIKEVLDDGFKPYLKLASANVKLANRRVTVLGEVVDPGVHYLYNEQNTILEAIGMAGDFTSFGNRQKVKLIRQTDEGLRSVYLNLKRSDFLATPYYYVHPNDMIYVEPLRVKSFDQSARSAGVIISGISLAVLIVNLFVK